MLSSEIKIELIEEINTQWEFHLITRSVFHSKFPDSKSYFSPKYYSEKGFSFKIDILNEKIFEEKFKSLNVWLNQNYIIRLFGILDHKGILKEGIKRNSEIIILIRLLRNNVGAHTSGRKVSRNKIADFNKATQLINKLCNRNISVENVSHFVLSVDSVLEPIKELTIEFIKEL